MAFRKRAETLQVHSESKDLPVKVRNFQCHDETTLGKHHKKWNWTFDIGGSKQEWELKIDEAVVGKKTLHFTVDGKTIFKNAMQQDFEHTLPVRGTLKLDKPYEVKSMEFNASEIWYPATLTQARGDGKYEAEVLLPPDQYGNEKRKVHYPLVEARHIRDPVTKQVVQVPSTTLSLLVQKDAALLPEVTIDGHSFTSYFCVPSPAVGMPPAEIDLTVSKDRTNITANVGHGTLKQALDATRPDCKVFARSCKKSKLRCEWAIQIGSFGEHHIVAETKSKSSKEVNVSVDGHRVVGGSAADLRSGEWCADIAIQGKLALNYNVHRTNSSRVATDLTTRVAKNLLHSNTIRIAVPDHGNLETATLECDEVEFSSLQPYKALPAESRIDDSLDTFEMTHGLSVPYAKDDNSSTAALPSAFGDLISGWDFASDFGKLLPGSIGRLGIFTGSQQKAIVCL